MKVALMVAFLFAVFSKPAVVDMIKKTLLRHDSVIKTAEHVISCLQHIQSTESLHHSPSCTHIPHPRQGLVSSLYMFLKILIAGPLLVMRRHANS